MTIYLTQYHHYSISQAGFVMGLFGAGAVAGGFLGGRLTDKYGFHYIQLLTLSGGGLFFIILGQMESYPLICIFTFVLSLVNESFRPANATAIAHYSTPENRTRSYSLNRLAINLGWAVGGGLGGLLASFDYKLLFWVDGITNLVAAVMLWKLLPTPVAGALQTIKSSIIKINSAYKDKFYLVFIFFTTIFAICFFQMFTNLPVYYKQDLHLSEQFIGLLMAINGLIIASIEMVIVYQLEGKRSSLSYIVFGTFLCGLSFFLFNIFPGGALIAIIAMVVITIGEILSMPFMNSFWTIRSNAANRGQYAGLYTIAWATAQVIGPVAGAQIADHYNFTYLWWVIGTLCLVSAVGFLYMKNREARKP